VFFVDLVEAQAGLAGLRSGELVAPGANHTIWN
jgi:hypothetical protein